MRPIRRLLAVAVLLLSVPALADPAVDKLLQAHRAYAKRLETITYRFHDKYRTGAPPQMPFTDVERKGTVDRDGRNMRAKVEHTQPPHPTETQDLVENDEYLFHRQGNNGISTKTAHCDDGKTVSQAAAMADAFVPQMLRLPIIPVGGNEPFVESQLGKDAKMAEYYTVKEDDSGVMATLVFEGKEMARAHFSREHGYLLESFRGTDPRSGKVFQQVDIEYAKAEGTTDFWYPKHAVQKIWNDPSKEPTVDYTGDIEELKVVASFPAGHFTMEALDIFTKGDAEVLMDVRPTRQMQLLRRKNGQWVGQDGKPAPASPARRPATGGWPSPGRLAILAGVVLVMIGGLRLLARSKSPRR